MKKKKQEQGMNGNQRKFIFDEKKLESEYMRRNNAIRSRWNIFWIKYTGVKRY